MLHRFFFRCSVDPYLFDNFETVDGDFLAAKFKAFKFPESNYVQFKGTVSVCIDKCKGVSVIYISLQQHIFRIQFPKFHATAFAVYIAHRLGFKLSNCKAKQKKE